MMYNSEWTPVETAPIDLPVQHHVTANSHPIRAHQATNKFPPDENENSFYETVTEPLVTTETSTAGAANRKLRGDKGASRRAQTPQPHPVQPKTEVVRRAMTPQPIDSATQVIRHKVPADEAARSFFNIHENTVKEVEQQMNDQWNKLSKHFETRNAQLDYTQRWNAPSGPKPGQLAIENGPAEEVNGGAEEQMAIFGVKDMINKPDNNKISKQVKMELSMRDFADNEVHFQVLREQIRVSAKHVVESQGRVKMYTEYCPIITLRKNVDLRDLQVRLHNSALRVEGCASFARDLFNLTAPPKPARKVKVTVDLGADCKAGEVVVKNVVPYNMFAVHVAGIEGASKVYPWPEPVDHRTVQAALHNGKLEVSAEPRARADQAELSIPIAGARESVEDAQPKCWDVAHDERRFIIELNLEDFHIQGIVLKMEGTELNVQAKHNVSNEEGEICREFGRSFVLPSEVDRDSLRAVMGSTGVLKITGKSTGPFESILPRVLSTPKAKPQMTSSVKYSPNSPPIKTPQPVYSVPLGQSPVSNGPTSPYSPYGYSPQNFPPVQHYPISNISNTEPYMYSTYQPPQSPSRNPYNYYQASNPSHSGSYPQNSPPHSPQYVPSSFQGDVVVHHPPSLQTRTSTPIQHSSRRPQSVIINNSVDDYVMNNDVSNDRSMTTDMDGLSQRSTPAAFTRAAPGRHTFSGGRGHQSRQQGRSNTLPSRRRPTRADSPSSLRLVTDASYPVVRNTTQDLTYRPPSAPPLAQHRQSSNYVTPLHVAPVYPRSQAPPTDPITPPAHGGSPFQATPSQPRRAFIDQMATIPRKTVQHPLAVRKGSTSSIGSTQSLDNIPSPQLRKPIKLVVNVAQGIRPNDVTIKDLPDTDEFLIYVTPYGDHRSASVSKYRWPQPVNPKTIRGKLGADGSLTVTADVSEQQSSPSADVIEIPYQRQSRPHRSHGDERFVYGNQKIKVYPKKSHIQSA